MGLTHSWTRRSFLARGLKGGGLVGGGLLVGAIPLAEPGDAGQSRKGPPSEAHLSASDGQIAGSTYRLEPDKGVVQTVTLSPPSHADVFRANAVQVDVAPNGRPWRVRLMLRQDGNGGRYVTWRNVRWVDGVVPALDLAPRAVTSMELWSADGRTVQGWTRTGTYAGVDPVTVPSVGGVWEAWSLPFDVGASLPAFGARSGPQLSTTGSAPVLLDDLAAPNPINRPSQRHRSVGFAAGGSASAPIGVRRGQGWTLVASMFDPGTPSDCCFVSMFNRDQGRSLALEASGSVPYVRIDASTESSYDSLYRDVVGGVAVVTLIQPAGGGAGILRWNGHEVSASTPWSQSAALDTLVVNDLPPGPLRAPGATRYASIVFAPQPLDHATPSDPVPLIETWAAATAGQTL